eukprot:28437-Chlamydomonas_euryale.AAC.8
MERWLECVRTVDSPEELKVGYMQHIGTPAHNMVEGKVSVGVAPCNPVGVAPCNPVGVAPCNPVRTPSQESVRPELQGVEPTGHACVERSKQSKITCKGSA